MVAEVKLAIQVWQTNPPRPSGICVVSGGKIIGVVALDSFKRLACRLDAMEVACQHLPDPRMKFDEEEGA